MMIGFKLWLYKTAPLLLGVVKNTDTETGKGGDDYILLFPNIAGEEPGGDAYKVNISQLVKYAYWGLVIAAAAFGSYKFISSIKSYFSESNPQLKSQYRNDIIEVFSGFAMFLVGWLVVGAIGGMMFDMDFMGLFNVEW